MELNYKYPPLYTNDINAKNWFQPLASSPMQEILLDSKNSEIKALKANIAWREELLARLRLVLANMKEQLLQQIAAMES